MGSQVRERLLLLVGLVVLVVAGVVIASSVGGTSDDPPTDATPDTTPEDVPDDGPAPEVANDAAGPLDGLESLRLDIEVTPSVGLVDGQEVEVTGVGFDPGASVVIIQCWIADQSATRDDCDLGSLAVSSAGEQGSFSTSVVVHQLLDTTNGVRDCAVGTEAVGCRVSVANTHDLDQSGAASVSFVGEDLAAPPSLVVSPTTGLRDGDPLTVSGTGFEPGSEVFVTQCPVGGDDDAGHDCLRRNPGETVETDAQGAFSVSAAANRHPQSVHGVHDCALDIHHCMVVVRPVEPARVMEVGDDGTIVTEPYVPRRAPNPVPLVFDAATSPTLPPEYTVTPSDGLRDGDTVRLELFDMPSDGVFDVQQCADGGPRGMFCATLGTVEIVDGDGAAEVAVVVTLTNGDDTIECTQPGRRCHLTLADEPADVVRGPLTFAP